MNSPAYYSATITLERNEQLEGEVRRNRIFYPHSVKHGRFSGDTLLELFKRKLTKFNNGLRNAIYQDLYGEVNL